jgi:hypothetical protein
MSAANEVETTVETRTVLFDEVARITGLPSQVIRQELENIIKKQGADPDTLTLEQLKEAMVEYMKEVLVHQTDQVVGQ